MTELTLVQELGEFAASASWGRLPEEVRDAAPGRVLDIVGLCLAAWDLDTSQAVAAHVAGNGGAPQAVVLGPTLTRAPVPGAALVNGTLAHSLDYDDTHLPSILHPSASVVPAVLATAELVGATGTATLAAIAVGVEVCVRLGMAGYDEGSGQSLFFERGQHATSICGTLGSAAGAAALMGLDAEGVAHAIGIAASMGSGVIEANRTGGTVKRMHCGWAAHAGVTAADFARRGITGPPTVLEGRFGFYQAWLDGRFDPRQITDGLGDVWALPLVHYKPYPANHFTHAVADCAITLRNQGVSADQVAAVEVVVATPTVRTIGEPIDEKRRPRSGYHAKFSAPYVFAAALTGGGGLGLGHEDFTDAAIHDPVREALMDLVTVTGGAECDAAYPRALPAVVCVRTRRGEEFVVRAFQNRGGPERPLSDGELQRKFMDNATRAVSEEVAVRIATAVRTMASLETASDIWTPLN